MNAKAAYYATRTEFARWNGLSPRTVLRLFQDGLPVERSGNHGAKVRIPTAEAQAWLTQREVNRQCPTDGRTLESERLRLISEQADREALENARKRSALIPSDQVETVYTATIALVVNRLEGVAGRLAHELVNINNPAVIREKLLIEHRAIRQAVADGLGEFGQTMPG